MQPVMSGLSEHPCAAFLAQVRMGAWRWLHALDLDPASRTFGVADREYWAWKVKDFPNGTWQGGIAGFLDVSPELGLSTTQLIKIVSAVVQGSQRIQRRDGSFEEAYPLESSYCVTALVLFNLLYAWECYPQYFEPETQASLTVIVEKGLRFLETTPETHGIISNHLATGVMALTLARRFLKQPDAERDISQFLVLQQEEGWFPEYGGADPGYQTLLNYYLLAGNRILQRADIAEALTRSLRFVSYFAFPDGSFAGEVGHRGTSIFYPAGSLAVQCGEQGLDVQPSALTDWAFCRHLSRPDAVCPTSVDAGNFVPVFNAWALLAHYLPFGYAPGWQYQADGAHHWPKADLWLVREERAMLAFSARNSALRRVVRHDDWQDESLVALTHGALTTQGCPPHEFQNDATRLQWQYQAIPRKQPLNNLVTAMIMRILGLLCLTSPLLQRILKKLLVKVIMQTSQQPKLTGIHASIDLSKPDLPVSLQGEALQDWQKRTFGFHQHMASANTFQERAL